MHPTTSTLRGLAADPISVAEIGRPSTLVPITEVSGTLGVVVGTGLADDAPGPLTLVRTGCVVEPPDGEWQAGPANVTTEMTITTVGFRGSWRQHAWRRWCT